MDGGARSMSPGASRGALHMRYRNGIGAHMVRPVNAMGWNGAVFGAGGIGTSRTVN